MSFPVTQGFGLLPLSGEEMWTTGKTIFNRVHVFAMKPKSLNEKQRTGAHLRKDSEKPRRHWTR